PKGKRASSILGTTSALAGVNITNIPTTSPAADSSAVPWSTQEEHVKERRTQVV
ncbi:hypothetical protein NDU88_005450, partial [Pleurodeles waltl]